MDNKSFPKILRELLTSRKKNQSWLAAASKTTEATISRYLSGLNQPDIYIVVNIAKALDVSVDYLFGLTDIPIPKESIGAEFVQLMRVYERSDARDKKILWTVLERYMTDEEKECLINLGYVKT